MANIREQAGQGRYPRADGKEAGGHPGQSGRPGPRIPLPQRHRRRWAIAGGVVAFWLLLLIVTGSATASIIIMVGIAVFGLVIVAALRALGITRDHPWVQRLSSRPWRDGRAVLNIAVQHLSEVFILTPSGSMVAPDFVELRMNPGDLSSLREWLDLDQVNESMTEAYHDEVTRRGARFAGSGRPEVYVVGDDSLPQGRYQLRRGLPASARPAVDYGDAPDGWLQNQREFAYGGQPSASAGASPAAPAAPGPVAAGPNDRTWLDISPGRTVMDGMATVVEQIRPAVPKLRLTTGSAVAETTMSGARAGRGAVELELPDVPTVSRVHATFTYVEGRWWVNAKGVNGLLVNRVEVTDKQALSDGDLIRWGKGADAPVSAVKIG